MTACCKTCFFYQINADPEIGPCFHVVEAYDETGSFDYAIGPLPEGIYLDEKLGCSLWEDNGLNRPPTPPNEG